MSEVQSRHKRKTKQETSNNKGRRLVPFWKRQKEAKCISTHLVLWGRGREGVAITIQWLEERGGEKSIRETNLKRTPNYHSSAQLFQSF